MLPCDHNLNLNLLAGFHQVAKTNGKEKRFLSNTDYRGVSGESWRLHRWGGRRGRAVGSRRTLVIINTSKGPILSVFWSWAELRNLKNWIPIYWWALGALDRVLTIPQTHWVLDKIWRWFRLELEISSLLHIGFGWLSFKRINIEEWVGVEGCTDNLWEEEWIQHITSVSF